MDKIDRLKQLLLTHRTENISKLNFEQRMNYDDVFAQEIVKLFAIPDVVEQSEELVCDVCKGVGTRNIEGETDDCWFCNGTGEVN